MGPYFGPILLVVAALTSKSFAGVKDDPSPMVAFLCGKPAMYLQKEGWVRDETKDCLKDPVEILNYCKEVYRDLDVTNVVEASERVTIDNWCSYERSHCKHHGSHTVRPFRCLVGPFQSDALLVPEHCLFDHIHDQGRCMSMKNWNFTASTACQKEKMKRQSSAVLLPCGIGMYGGVEFVCCPESHSEVPVDKDTKPVIAHKPAESKEEDSSEEEWNTNKVYPDKQSRFQEKEGRYPEKESKEEDYYEDEDDYEDEEFYDDEYDEDVEEDDYSEEETDSSEERYEVQPPEVLTDAYAEYLKKPKNEWLSEHAYFGKAKVDLQKHHHEKVTKMMKEWAVARQRVEDMKKTDPKAADKLNKEITARFQKTYQALEEEEMAEKNQLVAVHQQRIQADLSDKKRSSMEHYMRLLQRDDADATQILKSLQHYIKTEEKDRMHSVNHFKHLLDTNPDAADRIRYQVVDHLNIIDQRVAQAKQMLNRVPDIQGKVLDQVDKWMQSFSEIDARIDDLLKKPEPAKPAEPEEPTDQDIVEKYKEMEAESDKEEDVPEEMEIETDESEDDDLHRVPLEQNQEFGATKFDDETMEDESVFVQEQRPVKVAHQAASNLELEANYIKSEHISAMNPPMGSALGIAIGSVSVFVLIVVGIVILKKRSQRVPINHGFVEVDPAASPEERHVANMQMNGYENPTYKYFEMGTTNA